MRFTVPSAAGCQIPAPDRQRLSRVGLTACLLLILSLGSLPACRPDAPNPPSTAASPVASPTAHLEDGKPQSGLRRLKLYLGAKELSAELALTDETIRKGMMWRTNVAETDGMLFVFGRPHQTSFWMKNVPMNIDVAYLNPEGVILEIHRLERQNTNPVVAANANIQYALETAEGWYQRHGIGTGAVVRTELGSLPETFFRGATPR